MNTLAILCGVLGVIGYFFYFIIGQSQKGSDGQGVNLDSVIHSGNVEPCAQAQKGRWD